MPNEDAEMSLSEQELRKILADAILEYRQSMWLRDEGKARIFVQKEFDQRFKLWKRAAELGVPEGQWFIGGCYNFGIGATEDDNEAVKWYQKAAAQGNPDAQTSLADCLYDGEGIEEDKAEAVKWYRAAADQDYAKAQHSLGICYLNGDGVPEDDKEGIRWIQKLVAQGHPAAQYVLGQCYQVGSGLQQDDNKAVEYFQKSAAQGYPDAQNSLADCLLDGIGIEENDAEAIKWYRDAAEQGNADAQNILGVIYEKGKLVPKDVVKAVSLFRKAADQDLPVAQCNLALKYEYGPGVPKNLKIAAEWYLKSADNGYARAQYMLGRLYLEGKGVARDETEGIKWLKKAAEQHFAPATKRLNKLHSGSPAAPESEIPDKTPEQDTPAPQEVSEPPVEEKKADEQAADAVDASPLIVVQCKCGRLMAPPCSVNGHECACPFCHARIKIPAGPNPMTYLISDLYSDRKEETPRTIAASTKSAIVTIVTDDGTGSGFFVTSDGLIITNNHVVDGCASVTVKQGGAPDIRGRVIRSFHKLDLAFVKVHVSRQTPFVRMAQTNQVQVGDGAFAIGSPHAFEGTFTEGVISGLDRVIDGCHFIQTDAPISPGNSGGPLLNTFGEVVGVNKMYWGDSQNINFAIPVSVVRDCLYEVVTNRCEEKKYCSTCGHASSDTTYCDNCGVKFESNDDAAQQSAVAEPQVKAQQHKDGCAVCGAKLDPNASYCPHCGVAFKRGEN